jgi:hypothetical protein
LIGGPSQNGTNPSPVPGPSTETCAARVGIGEPLGDQLVIGSTVQAGHRDRSEAAHCQR